MKKFIVIIVLAVLAYRLYQKNRFYVVPSLPLGLRGSFIPPIGTFISSEHDSPIVREHEQCHYEQWKKIGTVNFFLQYLFQYIGYGYNRMPMERECRINEPLICQENYTNCYPKSF